MASVPTQLHSIITDNSNLYDTLPTSTSIRIMKLYPGVWDENLLCSFVVVDFEKSESFHALSYCWGKEPAAEVIFCNGHRFRVTKNLFMALQHLRLASKVRYMWVDAVRQYYSFALRDRF